MRKKKKQYLYYRVITTVYCISVSVLCPCTCTVLVSGTGYCSYLADYCYPGIAGYLVGSTGGNRYWPCYCYKNGGKCVTQHTVGLLQGVTKSCVTKSWWHITNHLQYLFPHSFTLHTTTWHRVAQEARAWSDFDCYREIVHERLINRILLSHLCPLPLPEAIYSTFTRAHAYPRWPDQPDIWHVSCMYFKYVLTCVYISL